MPEKVSGNPEVFKEAREEHKHGGRVGKKHHGKKHRKHGGKVEHHGKHREMGPEGEMAKHRMDRPRRARGGGVGADKRPFSSAHHSTSAGEMKGGEPD